MHIKKCPSTELSCGCASAFDDSLTQTGDGKSVLFALYLLKDLETSIKLPIWDVFRVVIGSGLGGLVAVALSMGRSVDDIIKTFRAYDDTCWTDATDEMLVNELLAETEAARTFEQLRYACHALALPDGRNIDAGVLIPDAHGFASVVCTFKPSGYTMAVPEGYHATPVIDLVKQGIGARRYVWQRRRSPCALHSLFGLTDVYVTPCVRPFLYCLYCRAGRIPVNPVDIIRRCIKWKGMPGEEVTLVSVGAGACVGDDARISADIHARMLSWKGAERSYASSRYWRLNGNLGTQVSTLDAIRDAAEQYCEDNRLGLDLLACERAGRP